MRTDTPGNPGRVPHGLGSRLVRELRRIGARLPPPWGTAAPDAAEQLTARQFAVLYRMAIDELCVQVARGNGHPPMTKLEVDLMCRCALTCRTLEQAILCARDFCAMLHPRAASLELETLAGVARFRMVWPRRESTPATCLLDITGLLCFMHLFGWLIGQPLRLIQVFLEHPRRDDAAPFLGLFGASVKIACASSGFEFDATLLAQPVVRQAAELDSFLVDLPFGLVSGRSAMVSVTQQMRGFIHAALERGEPLPALPSIARLLDTSESTLRRRLERDGTNYRALREDCLRETAERYLLEADWPIERIAGRLGFSSAAAFRRAFVSWTGKAPARFRRQGGQVSPAERGQGASAERGSTAWAASE